MELMGEPTFIWRDTELRNAKARADTPTSLILFSSSAGPLFTDPLKEASVSQVLGLQWYRRASAAPLLMELTSAARACWLTLVSTIHLQILMLKHQDIDLDAHNHILVINGRSFLLTLTCTLEFTFYTVI